jgi:hypothetical protein
MSTRGPTFVSSRDRRRDLRRRRRTRWAIGVLVGGALFVLGVALGEALHDNPQSGATTTSSRTIRPLPLPARTQTVTVTTSAP